jgi:hypothetical protein
VRRFKYNKSRKGLELTDKVTVNENELARMKIRDRLFGTLDKDKQPSNYIEGTKQILRDIEAFEDENGHRSGRGNSKKVGALVFY